MGRFSSIGSPLLSFMQKGDCRLSPGALWSITTLPVWPVLSEISPRATSEALKRPFVLGVTVSVWPSQVIRGGCLAETTFLIMTWAGRWQELIESSLVSPSRLSQLDRLVGRPVCRHGERWYPVWISQQITQLEAKGRLVRWFVGSGHVRSRA